MSKYLIALNEEKGVYELREMRGLMNRDEIRYIIIDSCQNYNPQIKKILTQYSVENGIKKLCQDIFLPYAFIEEYEPQLEKYWNEITSGNILTEDIIVKYFDKIVPFFVNILSFQRVSEEFIEEHIELINENSLYWKIISTSQKLSENFLLKYFDKISWEHAISNFDLSETVLLKVCRTFQISDWNVIMRKQNLTENFIEEFADLLNWPSLINLKKIDEKRQANFKDLIHCQNYNLHRSKNSGWSGYRSTNAYAW